MGRSRWCSRQFSEPLDVGDLVPDKLHTRTHEMRETKKKLEREEEKGKMDSYPCPEEEEEASVPLLLLEEERLQT